MSSVKSTMIITSKVSSLQLRLIAESDWLLFLQLHLNEQVLQYVTDPLTESQIRQRFEERLQPWQPGDLHWLCFVIDEKSAGQSIGVCGFHALATEALDTDALVTAEVGYLLLPDFYGKGYATQALQATLEYGAKQGIQCWQAVVTEGNSGSCRVLEKNGFHLVERQHNGYQIGDKFYADLLYRKSAIEE